MRDRRAESRGVGEAPLEAGTQGGSGEHAPLVLFDRARQALADAHSVDEVKTVRDQAEAMRAYLKQQRASLEMQNQCAEIRLRAERKLGEMLAGRPKLHGARPADAGSHDVTPLASQAVTKMQSHRWQLVAGVPEKTFDEHVGGVRERREELTTAGVLRLARRLKGEHTSEPVQLDLVPAAGQEATGLLPLELLWPTPRLQLLALADRCLRWLEGMRAMSLEHEEWTVCETGDGQSQCVVDRMRDAAAEVWGTLEGTAPKLHADVAALRDLAACARRNPIEPDDPELVRANERQKNFLGYCGVAGCWQPGVSDGRCSGHPPGSRYLSCEDEAPSWVFDSAGPENHLGIRPGWSAWGMEVIELSAFDQGTRRE